MGAAAAVGAGVSVISGIAGINEKNRQAAAQAQAAADERYRQQAASWAQSESIRIQAQTAQQTQDLNLIAQLSNYVTRARGLEAQAKATEIAKINQDYAINSSALEAQTQLAAERGNLARQETSVESQYSQAAVGADQRAEQVNRELGSLVDQLVQQLDTGSRQRAAQASRFRLQASSDTLANQANERTQIINQLGTLLGIDQEEALAAMQNANETTLADIARAVGLSDVRFGRDTNTRNEGIVSSQRDFMLQDSARTAQQQSDALALAQNQALSDYAIQYRSSADTYAGNQALYGVQQQAGQATSASIQDSLKRQQDSYRGAGFLDYVNLGLQSYQAISPLVNRQSTQTQTSTRSPQVQNIFGSIPY